MDEGKIKGDPQKGPRDKGWRERDATSAGTAAGPDGLPAA